MGKMEERRRALRSLADWDAADMDALLVEADARLTAES